MLIAVARIHTSIALYWEIWNFQGKNLETDFGSALPLIIFGSVGLIAGITSLILPETTAKSLPETVEDADTLDNK